jgi:hypothetical protein
MQIRGFANSAYIALALKNLLIELGIRPGEANKDLRGEFRLAYN